MGRKLSDELQAPLNSLRELGRQIKANRKALKLSANEVSEAAGISRVTLYRIEKGESGVTAGAYAAALHSLGHRISLTSGTMPTGLAAGIDIEDFAGLKSLCWQLKPHTLLSPAEAWSTYARNWRFLDEQSLEPSESELIRSLRAQYESIQSISPGATQPNRLGAEQS